MPRANNALQNALSGGQRAASSRPITLCLVFVPFVSSDALTLVESGNRTFAVRVLTGGGADLWLALHLPKIQIITGFCAWIIQCCRLCRADENDDCKKREGECELFHGA